MRKNMYRFGFLLLATTVLLSCGGTKKEKEDTEFPPAEPVEASNDEMEMPEQVNVKADSRIAVTFNKLNESSDTTAAMISGYIEANGAPVAIQKLKLLLHTKALNGTKPLEHDYTVKIEDDGRVPGIWVPEDSDCDFALVAAKDTFRFSMHAELAIYRFKLQFKPKS